MKGNMSPRKPTKEERERLDKMWGKIPVVPNPILPKIKAIEKALEGIDFTESFFHRRLHDFEMFDEVKFSVIPRFKTSGLSGDEWRYSVLMEFFFKGVRFKEEHVRDMDIALKYIGHSFGFSGEGVPDEWLKVEKKCCDQVGCKNDATKWFALKKLTSKEGDYLEPTEGFVYYRKFCDKHVNRGNADREDSDGNYVSIPEIKE